MNDEERNKLKQDVERRVLKNEKLLEDIKSSDSDHPYDPRDYNDGPLSAQEVRALWIDPEQFNAACEELFKRFKAFVKDHTQPEPPYPPGRGRRYYR